MESVKIIYDDITPALPVEIETVILDNLQKILEKLDSPKGFISIFICTIETIRSLNLQFRNIDKPTDVLSWRYEDQPGDFLTAESPWGELAVCLEIVEKQAKSADIELPTELLRLIVHGLVHLLGFDHETEADEEEMLGREIELLSSIGLGDIYTS